MRTRRPEGVAQISHLPYRRIPFCQAHELASRLVKQHALPIGNLEYTIWIALNRACNVVALGREVPREFRPLSET